MNHLKIFLLLLPSLGFTTLSINKVSAGEPVTVMNLAGIAQSQRKIPTLNLTYGLNLGAYFANPSTANYYNGSGEHSVDVALNRYYNKDKLIANVDEIIQDFQIGDLPLNMHYNPSVQVGFFAGLNFDSGLALVGEFNYTKLNLADRFTIFTDKFTSTSEPYRLLSDIYGSEERIELRLGFQFTRFSKSATIHPFIESGLNITDTKVIENNVLVKGMEFNIREIRVDYYDVRDYGMGLGIYTSLGVLMQVSENLSFRTAGSVSFSRINLGNNARIAPQYTLYLRLNLHDLFAGN